MTLLQTPFFVPLRSKRYQFSKRPTTIPHLPPDRIALVSCEFLMLQEVPENGVTLSSLRVRYAPFRREPQSSTALRILFKPTSERV